MVIFSHCDCCDFVKSNDYGPVHSCDGNYDFHLDSSVEEYDVKKLLLITTFLALCLTLFII